MKHETRQPAALDGVSLRRIRYAPDTRQRRHYHDRTSLTLVFGGSLDETVGRTREEAGPLSVVFKPAGTEHANRIGPDGAATLQLEFGSGVLPAGDEEASSWGWAHGGPAASGFLALARRLGRGEADRADLDALLFDLLSRFSDNAGATRDPPAWLRRIAEELDDTFKKPRSVRELAADAAVHPVALARAHRRHFDCSITERLRAHRVRDAVARLGSGETLGAAAFASGFSDQPHMTRVFRRELGITPGDLRSIVTG